MADKKKDEGPKPKLHNPLLDKSIDDVLKDYQSLYSEKNQLEQQKERGYDRDSLYSTVVGHLAQHGTDEKTKLLKRHSYHDMKGDDKKKWTQDLLHRLALHGVAKLYGKEAVDVYAKNQDILRDFIEKHMVTDKVKSYEGLVELLSESKNLKDDFYDNDDIKEVFENYTASISSMGRKVRDYQRHLLDPEHYTKVTDFVDKAIKPHKLRLKKGAGLQALVQQVIPATANPEFKPKKNKIFEEIPEEEEEVEFILSKKDSVVKKCCIGAS